MTNSFSMTSWEMEILIAGVWTPVRESCTREVFRYDESEDARIMLDKLYPDLPSDMKRVVKAKVR